MATSTIALNCERKKIRQIALSTCILMRAAIEDIKICSTSYRR